MDETPFLWEVRGSGWDSAYFDTFVYLILYHPRVGVAAAIYFAGPELEAHGVEFPMGACSIALHAAVLFIAPTWLIIEQVVHASQRGTIWSAYWGKIWTGVVMACICGPAAEELITLKTFGNELLAHPVKAATAVVQSAMAIEKADWINTIKFGFFLMLRWTICPSWLASLALLILCFNRLQETLGIKKKLATAAGAGTATGFGPNFSFSYSTGATGGGAGNGGGGDGDGGATSVNLDELFQGLARRPRMAAVGDADSDTDAVT